MSVTSSIRGLEPFWRTWYAQWSFSKGDLHSKQGFTLHLVTKSSAGVHQHVAYVTAHREACSQTLHAASWAKCWQ
jgi:hypothetical protein